MADLNTISLTGRLVRDSDLTYTEGGMAILKFSIANNRRVRKGDEWVDIPNYFDCVMFSKRAESLANFLKKGRSLGISGSLKFDSWKDKNTGDNRSRVSIMVENLQLFGQATGAGASNQNSADKTEPSGNYTANESESFDEDIPF